MTEVATPEVPTADEVARHYAACLDSVNLLKAGKPEQMEDGEWADCVARNREHLELMLAKTYWTDQDLTPLREAIGE